MQWRDWHGLAVVLSTSRRTKCDEAPKCTKIVSTGGSTGVHFRTAATCPERDLEWYTIRAEFRTDPASILTNQVCLIVKTITLGRSNTITLSWDELSKRVAHQPTPRHLGCPRSSRRFRIGRLPWLPGRGAAHADGSARNCWWAKRLPVHIKDGIGEIEIDWIEVKVSQDWLIPCAIGCWVGNNSAQIPQRGKRRDGLAFIG